MSHSNDDGDIDRGIFEFESGKTPTNAEDLSSEKIKSNYLYRSPVQKIFVYKTPLSKKHPIFSDKQRTPNFQKQEGFNTDNKAEGNSKKIRRKKKKKTQNKHKPNKIDSRKKNTKKKHKSTKNKKKMHKSKKK